MFVFVIPEKREARKQDLLLRFLLLLLFLFLFSSFSFFDLLMQHSPKIFGGGGTAEHPTPQTRAAALTTLLPKPNAAPIPGTTAST